MRTYLVLVSVILLSACGGSVTDPAGQISLSLETTPTEMQAGEPMTLRMIVVNQGATPRAVNTSMCPDPFVVQTSDGEPVPPAMRICSAQLTRRMLGRGEEMELSMQWPGDVASGLLSPGDYSLRGRISVEDIGLVQSDPVSIRILP